MCKLGIRRIFAVWNLIQESLSELEYSRADFLKDTSIISNLIFAIQQVTIMQIIADSKLNAHWL